MISCKVLDVVCNNFWSKFVDHMLKSYNTKLSNVKPRDNVILKSIILNFKIKLSHGLVSFQRERTSFFLISTHMQVNEKIIYIWNKIETISLLIKNVYERKIYFHQKYDGSQVSLITKWKAFKKKIWYKMSKMSSTEATVCGCSDINIQEYARVKDLI